MTDPVLPHEIEAVLDGTMSEPRANEIRRRVAEDEALREQYGAMFELELFAPDAATATSVSNPPVAPTRPQARWPWIVGPLVAAAAILLVLFQPTGDNPREVPTPASNPTPNTTVEAPLGISALVGASVEHTQRGPRGVVYETWKLRDDGVWIGARVEESDNTSGWRVTQRLVAKNDR